MAPSKTPGAVVATGLPPGARRVVVDAGPAEGPTGPFQIGRPSMVASAPPRTLVATAAQSECVTPDCSNSSSGDSLPGNTCNLRQPLPDVTNMTPETGSATGGPVMLAPPPPPGQFQAGPVVHGPGGIEHRVEEVVFRCHPTSRLQDLRGVVDQMLRGPTLEVERCGPSRERLRRR